MHLWANLGRSGSIGALAGLKSDLVGLNRDFSGGKAKISCQNDNLVFHMGLRQANVPLLDMAHISGRRGAVSNNLLGGKRMDRRSFLKIQRLAALLRLRQALRPRPMPKANAR